MLDDWHEHLVYLRDVFAVILIVCDLTSLQLSFSTVWLLVLTKNVSASSQGKKTP